MKIHLKHLKQTGNVLVKTNPDGFYSQVQIDFSFCLEFLFIFEKSQDKCEVCLLFENKVAPFELL